MRRSLRYTILWALFFTACGCTQRTVRMYGQVIDAESKQPITGANIKLYRIFMRHGESHKMMITRAELAKRLVADSARTDANGIFLVTYTTPKFWLGYMPTFPTNVLVISEKNHVPLYNINSFSRVSIENAAIGVQYKKEKIRVSRWRVRDTFIISMQRKTTPQGK